MTLTTLKYLEHEAKLIKKELALYEGLIASYPPKQMVATLQSMIGKDGRVHYNKDNPTVLDVTLTTDMAKKYFTDIQDRIRMGGYFLATINTFAGGRHIGSSKNLNDAILLAGSREHATLEFVIEAKFGYDVTEELIKSTQFLYHATPQTKLEKILRQGLVPKSYKKLADHPDRTYLTRSPHHATNFTFMVPTVRDWSILKIDIRAFRRGARLFTDPAFENGYYTLSNIAPEYIALHANARRSDEEHNLVMMLSQLK